MVLPPRFVLTTASCSATLSTSQSNDIVIAFTIEGLDLQIACVFTICDTGGLSWVSRSIDVFGNNGRNQLQEFYVESPSALLSDMITESISGCGTNYNGLMVFGVSGANFNSPLEPNATLPGSAIGCGKMTSVTISTRDGNDMII